MIAKFFCGVMFVLFVMALITGILGIWWYSVLFLTLALIIAVTYVLLVLFTIISAIPYFILGKRAGFKYYGIGLIPGLHNYIAFALPHREYDLGIFRTKHRKIIFWVWFVIDVLLYLSMDLMNIIIASSYNYKNSYYPERGLVDYLPENPLVLTILLFYVVFMLCMLFLRTIFHWRKNYDLLKTYGYGNHAIWAPTANIFCPLVMTVFSYKFIAREPDYGYGGYYMPYTDAET